MRQVLSMGCVLASVALAACSLVLAPKIGDFDSATPADGDVDSDADVDDDIDTGSEPDARPDTDIELDDDADPDTDVELDVDSGDSSPDAVDPVDICGNCIDEDRSGTDEDCAEIVTQSLSVTEAAVLLAVTTANPWEVMTISCTSATGGTVSYPHRAVAASSDTWSFEFALTAGIWECTLHPCDLSEGACDSLLCRQIVIG